MSTFEQFMDMWRVMYDNVCMVQTQHAGHGKSHCAFCNNGFLRHVGYVDAEFGADWYYDCWVARRTPGAVQLLPALFAGHRFLWLQLPRGLLGPRVPRKPWTTLQIPAWNMFPNWISRRRSPTAVGVKRKCAVFFLFRKTTEVVRLEWKLAGTTSREKGNHFIYFQCKERCFGSMPVNFFRVKNLVRVDSPRMNKMPFIRMFTYPISMRLGFDLGSIRFCSWSYDSRNLRWHTRFGFVHLRFDSWHHGWRNHVHGNFLGAKLPEHPLRFQALPLFIPKTSVPAGSRNFLWRKPIEPSLIARLPESA